MTARHRILIVDDEAIVRRSHARVLIDGSNEVTTAADGVEALDAMRTTDFDLVLLDMRMPGADGLDVLRSIKAQSPESEVVIVTGYPEIEAAKQAIKLGAYTYLTKPVEPDQIRTVAESAIRHKGWAVHGVSLH